MCKMVGVTQSGEGWWIARAPSGPSTNRSIQVRMSNWLDENFKQSSISYHPRQVENGTFTQLSIPDLQICYLSMEIARIIPNRTNSLKFPGQVGTTAP